MPAIRCFPFRLGDGAYNMAADEMLLHAAAQGLASLRFYGWSRATVSLGYFQPAAVRHQHAGLARLPWVRRPSGGKTLVHHHELTYALALPPGFAADWMMRMHRGIILPALERLGLGGHIHVVDKESIVLDEVLCFGLQTRGDLICVGKKIVGSAQRKHHRSLLQHGAILLAQSEHAPQLQGIKELTGLDLPLPELQQAILEGVPAETGWEIIKTQWAAEEEKAILKKATDQYATAEWNEKR